MRYLITVLSIALFPQILAASEVNVYTSRHYDSDAALYSEFTDLTDIKVNVISGKGPALIERIKSEGVNLKLFLLDQLLVVEKRKRKRRKK